MKKSPWIILILFVFLGTNTLVFAQDGSDNITIEPEENSNDESPSLFEDEDEADKDTTDDEESDEQEVSSGNYTLEFNAETQVTFSHILTGEAYISIRYLTHIKQDVDLAERRFEAIGYAEIETEVTGQYASSQFFACTLEVEIDRTLVDIKTRNTTVATTEDEESKTQLALQIAFDKSYSENWYSNCRGNDESTLNTIAQDSPENYNLQILDLMTPTLKGLAIDDFTLGQAVSFDITMESFDADDFDTGENVFYEGSGTITLTPQ